MSRETSSYDLYGGVRGRLDHTAANFAVLKYLNGFDAQGYLIDERTVATVITDDKFTLPKNARGTVSVLAYGGDAEGVCIKGLKYELKDAIFRSACQTKHRTQKRMCRARKYPSSTVLY